MMGWYGGGWGAGQWVGMGLGMLVFWGLVIALIVALLRWSGPEHHRDYPATPAAGPDQSAALQILDERFARGELTEDEYRSRRAVLQAR